MNTKQPEALTLAQKLENAPAWESQSPTIYGWNDSGETLADAAAELRRLHSDNETLRCKLQTLEKLGAACDDVQLLRLGYVAARQEIASLKAQHEGGKSEALADLAYAHGMTTGWNLCIADKHDEFARIRSMRSSQAISTIEAPQPAAQAQEDVPDMFWDADDTENFAHEIQDIIDGYGPGEIVTIECAKRLPNFRAVVTRDGDGISYEYLEAAIAAQRGEAT